MTKYNQILKLYNMVNYSFGKNLTQDVSGISHWPVGWSVSCSLPVKLVTLPIKHVVDSVMLFSSRCHCPIQY